MIDLAAIVARDAVPPRCPAAEDRRALLALLRETREALTAVMDRIDYIGGADARDVYQRVRAVQSALAALTEPTP